MQRHRSGRVRNTRIVNREVLCVDGHDGAFNRAPHGVGNHDLEVRLAHHHGRAVRRRQRDRLGRPELHRRVSEQRQLVVAPPVRAGVNGPKNVDLGVVVDVPERIDVLGEDGIEELAVEELRRAVRAAGVAPAVARVRDDGDRAVVIASEVLREAIAAVAAARGAIVERPAVAALRVDEVQAVDGPVIVERRDVGAAHLHEIVDVAVTQMVDDVHSSLHLVDERRYGPAPTVSLVERAHIHGAGETRGGVSVVRPAVHDLVFVCSTPRVGTGPEQLTDHQGLVALGDDRRVRVTLRLRDEIGDVRGDAAGDAADADLGVEVLLPDLAVVAVAVGIPSPVQGRVVEVSGDVRVRFAVGRGVETPWRNAVAVRRLAVPDDQNVVRRPRAVRVDDEVANLILGVVSRVVQGDPLLGEHADLLAALGPPGDIGVQVAFPGVRRDDDVVVRERGIQQAAELYHALDARIEHRVIGIVNHARQARERRVVVANHRLDAVHAGRVRLSDDLNVHAGVVRDRAASRLVLNGGESDVRDTVPAVAPEYRIRVKRSRIRRSGGIVRLRDLARARMRKRILHLPGLDDVAVSEHDPLA